MAEMSQREDLENFRMGSEPDVDSAAFAREHRQRVLS
jgi:hypothetical protein